jgi:hypothetical protein
VGARQRLVAVDERDQITVAGVSVCVHGEHVRTVRCT